MSDAVSENMSARDVTFLPKPLECCTANKLKIPTPTNSMKTNSIFMQVIATRTNQNQCC